MAWLEPYWTSAPRLTGMTSDATRVNAYEHELMFYNYCDDVGGCSYINRPEGYWTTLPGRTYLDEGWFANPDEVLVEVGTADADQLQAQVYYTIDVLMIDNPSSAWSLAKIRQARGWRFRGCWSWECVWEIDDQITVEFPDYYYVPGHIHWHF